MPPFRPLLPALAISLLLHLALVAGLKPWFGERETLVPLPLEARLTAPALPTAPPAPPPAPRPRPRSAPVPEPVPAAAVPAADEVSPPPPVETPHPAAAEPVFIAPPAPEPAAVPAEPPAVPRPVASPPAPPPPARPALRSLPARLEIRYQVQRGEDRFRIGHASYTWHARDGRYSLVSIAEASGLASLFISGRIVQLSEGGLGPAGLLPDQYWLQRNQRRQDVARFDRVNGRLHLGSQQTGQPLPEMAQDLLGFPFHLALTVAPDEPAFRLSVTNGRKLNDYAFVNLGRENVEFQGKARQALHLRGERPGEGSLDVWLDDGGSWLPLVIRTRNVKGEVMVLEAEKISLGGADPPDR